MSPPFRIHRLVALLALLLLCVRTADAQLNSQEQQFFNAMRSDSRQKRPSMEVDPILSRVARARATDMATRGYFAHTNPDGKGPNYLVRQAGYQLPAHYDQSATGNNIESCSAGDPTAQGAWEYLLDSPSHKRHLVAESPFYAEQTSVGIGYCYDPGSEYIHYWVILTAPPPGPTLSITSPAANAGIAATQVSISGTSGGQPAAARIVYKLENSNGAGTYVNASGVASWSGTVGNLTPGLNTIRVRSLDSSGATLEELTRSVRHVLLRPLTIAVVGEGTLTRGFVGTTQRELAQNYTVTAKPAVGWLFDRWLGGIDSTSATLIFNMEEGLSLTAHFRENPFYAAKGVYNGLIETASATHATSGFLKVTTAVTGAFSGNLTLGGKVYAIRGKFDAEGNAEVIVKRGALPPVTVSLHLDLAGGTQRIVGTLSDGIFTAGISADRALPAGATHFAAGRYTFALPAAPATGPEIPRGDGYGLLVVSPLGVAKLTGTLADGRSFTRAANLSADGDLPIYVALLGGTGSLIGTASFQVESGTFIGQLQWRKAERLADRFYPAAFDIPLGIAGARYVRPQAGTSVIEVAATAGNTSLQLEDGNLETMEQITTLTTDNLVTISDPVLPKLALRMTPATGRFSGSFTHPQTGAASRISGVILQNVNLGFGFFLGADQSGTASFGPVGQ